jgi:serine/threonine-protein kinase
VHRDIKPQNIIIRHEGQAILVDFGLVKLWDPNDPRTKTVMRGMGTPEYAPPEQYDLSLGHTDPRSDLYSLGATLYHALTGQAPPTATQRIASLEAFRAPREMNSRISPRAEAAVLRAMELPVAKRFATAEEMAAALPGPALAPVSLRRVPPKPARAKTMPEAAPPSVPSRRHVPRWVWGMGAVGALVVIAVGAWGLGLFGDGRGASRDLPQPTAAPEVEATIAPRPTATARSEAAALAKTQALHLAACCSGSDFYSVDPARTAFDYTTVQITSEGYCGWMGRP